MSGRIVFHIFVVVVVVVFASVFVAFLGRIGFGVKIQFVRRKKMVLGRQPNLFLGKTKKRFFSEFGRVGFCKGKLFFDCKSTVLPLSACLRRT